MSTHSGVSIASATARFELKSCPRCGGDGYLDVAGDGDWRCFQCGRVIDNVGFERLSATSKRETVERLVEDRRFLKEAAQALMG